MTAIVVRADSRALPLADKTVDLVVTSPPYFGLRSYTDGGEHYAGQVGAEATPAEFVDALLDVTAECMRVLKPAGSLWINLGDKYASNAPGGRAGSRLQGASQVERRGRSATAHPVPGKSLYGLPWRYALACIDQLGLILRAEVIWEKPNGMPESVTDRVRRSHEQWFHFTAQPFYFADVDALREAPSGYRRAAAARRTPSGQRPRAMTDACNPAGRLPGSVWSVATQPLSVPAELGIDHFAAFPLEWPRRIITGWSPPRGVVLDPFGGTGTTALVASALGRTGVTVDLSEDYCRLARWRTRDPAQRAKVLGRDPGQGDLFTDEGVA